ncbi:MAG: integrase arm-type DNA-binding domain-containing protein [Sulfurovum sp.]|nr:integrase arm-type DNA-binding domain-containing protein [Sulfurovum sp.]
MARLTQPLSATEIKNAKAKDKKYKLSDGRGLSLHILPNGSKLWRLKYRFNNKEKEYAIGTYPTISLAKARTKREELKELIADNIDPNQRKKELRQATQDIELKKENTFYNISQKWLKSYKSQVSENYHTRLGRALENYLYPSLNISSQKISIKNKPIDEITRKEIIFILEHLKDRDLLETAKRTAMLLNKIYKYAVTHEYTPHNIIADIELPIVLGKREKKHYPTLTKEKDIKALLLSIDEYSGDYYTKLALKVLPYVFVRSFNIRHMEWKEINFKTEEWIIPKEKMKTKKEFILPLSSQAITILQEAKENSLSHIYVFPSIINNDKPLSDNTLISALRRMGYSKDELVPHSFRSIFSTIAYEKANDTNGHNYTGEVIEACLAHKEQNKIKAAYNHSTYKEAMQGLMQWYGDHLEKMKNL